MAEGRDTDPKRPATERADELLNRAGWVAGMVGSMVGIRLARIAAFAREEAEDLWAEAQSMRRQNGMRERVGDTSEEPTRTNITVDATNAIRQESAGSDTEAMTIDATPAARRHAEEAGVDLRDVKGSGPGGRITVADVRNKVAARS